MNSNEPILEDRQPSFGGRIGAARRDITPPPGIYSRMWGCAAHDVAEGVHRPLLATAMSFQDAAVSPPLVLLSLDLGWWIAAEDEWFLRGHLLAELKLASPRLMVHLVHTHSGPSVSLQYADRPGGALIRPYLEAVRAAAVAAAQEALAAARPATLQWTTGRCNLARNRDLPEPGGTRVLCGYNPQPPADDTLLIGRVSDEQGKCLATLVNYACHPTTLGGGNRLISPDYVGAMRQTIEQASGGAPCLFLLGAAGELGPRRGYDDRTAVADANGRQLGYAALSALEGMLPPGQALRFAAAVESGATLATWRETPLAPPRNLAAVEASVPLTLKELPPADALAAQLRDCRDPVLAERLRRRLHQRRSLGDGPSFELPLWIWRLGDAVLLGVPAEAHSGLQIELRRRFPRRAVAVINIVNGHYSYLPPAADYAAGSYQVEIALFQAGCLEKLIETSTALIEAMP
jgi:hypothetical protein